MLSGIIEVDLVETGNEARIGFDFPGNYYYRFLVISWLEMLSAKQGVES
jgi:hypothetical protein